MQKISLLAGKLNNDRFGAGAEHKSAVGSGASETDADGDNIVIPPLFARHRKT